MRVTSVELQPAGSSNTCVLSFRDPRRSNPYNIRSIQGLDAEEIVPRFYGGPGNSNTRFYNLSLESRKIIVYADLNPSAATGVTYSSLRDDLYRIISSSRTGRLTIAFKDGETTVAVLHGFVSKFESPLFNKQPAVQITVDCDDPMLRSPDPLDIDVLGFDPALTIISDLLSTAPHGFKFEVSFSAGVAEFVINDPNDPDWEFRVSPSGGFLTGDVLNFSSEHNDKYIYLVRGGNTIYLADKIGVNSVWPILFPGDNDFAIASPLSVAWEGISHRLTYWGV